MSNCYGNPILLSSLNLVEELDFYIYKWIGWIFIYWNENIIIDWLKWSVNRLIDYLIQSKLIKSINLPPLPGLEFTDLNVPFSFSDEIIKINMIKACSLVAERPSPLYQNLCYRFHVQVENHDPDVKVYIWWFWGGVKSTSINLYQSLVRSSDIGIKYEEWTVLKNGEE